MNKTKMDVESAISEAMTKLLKEQMGEHVESILTQIVEDAIIARFNDVLPPAEKSLSQDQEGLKLIKELKERLIEKSKPDLKAIIENLVCTTVVDIHTSFNVETGELVFVINLDKDLEKAVSP